MINIPVSRKNNDKEVTASHESKRQFPHGSVVGKGEKAHLNKGKESWQDCIKREVGSFLLKMGEEMDSEENVHTISESGNICDGGTVKEERLLHMRHGCKRHIPFMASR